MIVWKASSKVPRKPLVDFSRRQSPRGGCCSVLLPVFVAGAWLLSRVDVAAGERQAGAA
jgi:hypothetical protein